VVVSPVFHVTVVLPEVTPWRTVESSGTASVPSTPDEIVYHRRLRLLDHAEQTSITEACRTFGISRTTYYCWADRAQRYGLAALMPKGRRSAAMPNSIPPETVEIVLAEAIARPTLGARRLLEHLEERSVVLSASGVQKILVRHCEGLEMRATRRSGVAVPPSVTLRR
jgi:transposase